jgi:hypothetical protein
VINHVRCLLLNITGIGFQPGIPGEEYVDPDFRALNLPPRLATIRRFLFGQNPDRAMLNYRLRQIMTILHSCELVDHVLALDPRITYWPPRTSSSFNKADFKTTVVQTAGAPANLYVQGPQQLTSSDKLVFGWIVSVIDSTTVRVQQLMPPFNEIENWYETTAGLSSQIALPGSPLLVMFNPVTGGQWFVESLARSAVNLEDAVAAADKVMSADMYDELFGGAKPYMTFGNLWSLQRAFPYKVGAFALALAYRCEALRIAGGV